MTHSISLSLTNVVFLVLLLQNGVLDKPLWHIHRSCEHGARCCALLERGERCRSLLGTSRYSLIVLGTDESGLVAEATVMVEIEVSASSTSAFYGYGNDF